MMFSRVFSLVFTISIISIILINTNANHESIISSGSGGIDLNSTNNNVYLQNDNNLVLQQINNLIIPKVRPSMVSIDGGISSNEYMGVYSDSRSGMTVYWQHDTINLTIGLEAPSTGWVAFGIGSGMQDSNMILGGVNDSGIYIHDLIGIPGFQHVKDTDPSKNGEDNILEYSSTENSTVTILEFIIPLSSNDTLDPILIEGNTYEIFFAYSASDDNILSPHAPMGRSEVLSIYLDDELYTEPPEELNLDDFDKSIPQVTNSSVFIDGIISDNEYVSSFTDQTSGITVYWEHNSINFTVGLVSPGTGWVALGIGISMAQSTIYIGGVENSQTYCLDLEGLENWQPPTVDTDNSGTDDILDCSATETSDQTTLEFIIPMNATDNLDTNLNVKTVYSMFLGYHKSSDDIADIHTAHSAVFEVLVMPVALLVETIMNLKATSIASINNSITLIATLSFENGSLKGIPITFFMKTYTGDIALGQVVTNDNGTAVFNYSNPNIFYERVFGARTQELIVVESGIVLAFQSSEQTVSIYFENLVEVEIDTKIKLSRVGLVVAFWLAGIIIWGGFGYVMYQMYLIFSDRNNEILVKDDFEENRRSDL